MFLVTVVSMGFRAIPPCDSFSLTEQYVADHRFPNLHAKWRLVAHRVGSTRTEGGGSLAPLQEEQTHPSDKHYSREILEDRGEAWLACQLLPNIPER